MFDKYTSRLSHAQPVIDSTRAVGDFTILNALRLKRLIVEVLKAIAKCWAFFKDVHFSFYVIIPVISSFTSLGRMESLLLWSLFFLPVLVVITFLALDSIFDIRGAESSSQPKPNMPAPAGRPPPESSTRARTSVGRSSVYVSSRIRGRLQAARRHRIASNPRSEG